MNTNGTTFTALLRAVVVATAWRTLRRSSGSRGSG
jgi:hypothetical protein